VTKRSREDRLDELMLWGLFQPVLERLEQEQSPEALAKHPVIQWSMQFIWSRRLIRRVRWFYVRKGFDRKMVPKAAYAWAARMLKGSYAQCGPDMMRKDFEAVEKTKGLARNIRPNSKQSFCT
jgi:hypothetical protein